MGAADLGGAPDQAGARGPRRRARRRLAAPPRMKARLSVSLHAVSVRRGGKWVLRDITWRLRAGERWALLGENGAGKTQLLKLLSGDVWPTPTGREDARIYRLGRRTRRSASRQSRASPTSAPSCRTSTPATAGTCACATWLPPDCTARICCCRRSPRARAQAGGGDSARLRLAAIARAAISCRCPTARSASRCWRAPWCSDPDWLLLGRVLQRPGRALSARASTRCSTRRAPRPVLGRDGASRLRRAARHARHARAARRAGARGHGVLRRADLARLTRRGGRDRAAPARGRRPAAGATAHGRRRRAAVDHACCYVLSTSTLYVDYRPVLRDLNWELAQRRALGGVRRERRRQNPVF